MLIDAIRQKHPDLPIAVHTHDTAGAGKIEPKISCPSMGIGPLKEK